ncbi:MAG: hypothetical protein HN350_05155 [Phycisphaerales bacterium]|jgi:hypothetical protein|nr:hypothetical protein [Phycisphaerales bacterium]
MINKHLSIAVVFATLCLGCSREYSQSRLDADGPEATQVKTLVAALRQAGADGLPAETTAQAIPGLTEPELKGLRFALGKIVSADSVELQKIERFGKVYRAVFALDTDGAPGSLSMLLGPSSDGKLKWYRPN